MDTFQRDVDARPRVTRVNGDTRRAARNAGIAAALFAPALTGLVLGILIASTESRVIDPASVIALGALVTLGAAIVVALAAGQRRAGRAQRAAARVALGVIAALVTWVVANRVGGVPTGGLKPSSLLISGAVVAAMALAALRYEHETVAAVRLATRWYRTYRERAGTIDMAAVVLVAIMFRAAVMFRMPAIVIGDSGVLLETASTLLERFSFAPLSTVFPPLYSLFLAAVRVTMGPDFLAVVAVQHALGIVTAVATYWLGRELVPPPLALTAALGVAANGYIIILEHGIYSEALFMPLAVVFALLAVRLLKGGGWKIAAAGGGTLALAALTRLVIQPAMVGIPLLLPLFFGWRRAVPRGVAFVGAFLVVVSPWLAHNQIVYGYLGLSNSLGMQLLPRLWEEEGTYQWASATVQDPVVRRALRSLQDDKDRGASWWEAWLRIEREFPERDTSALVTAAALDVIRRQPETYIDRTWFRLNRMWRGGFTKERVHDLYGQQDRLGMHSPIFGVRDEPEFAVVAEQEGNKADAVTLVFRPDMLPVRLTLALTTAAAAGMLASRRLRPALVPWGLGLGLLVLPVLLNADRARYLHPAEPFLLVTYAVGVQTVLLGVRWVGRRGRIALRSHFLAPAPIARAPV